MRTTRLVPTLAIVGLIVGGLASPVAGATPTISATPHRKLADGQQIMVSASGFAPDTFMAIVECPTATVSPSTCDLNTVIFTDTDSTGSYADVPFTVSRILSDGTDCATNGGCYVGTQDAEASGPTAATILRFDPKIPPLPPLEISVRWDKTPKVNSKGVIGLKGTLHCANRGSEVEVDTEIRQLDGRAIYTSFGFADLICAADSNVPFRMAIRPQDGLFAPGPAILNFQAFSFSNSNAFTYGRRNLTLVAATADFTNPVTVPRPNAWTS